MKRLFTIALAGILWLGACGTETGIEVHSAWMRPTSMGSNGAVYFELHNHSSTPDELTGVLSDVALAAEIHESRMEGDVMKMNMLTSLPLNAYADMEFKPGGLHIMLINLRQDFKVNDEFKITLQFNDSQDITVHVIVKDAAPMEEHDE